MTEREIDEAVRVAFETHISERTPQLLAARRYSLRWAMAYSLLIGLIVYALVACLWSEQ